MAASALFGRVGEFVPSRETFSSYAERMEMFFMANSIVEESGEDKVATNRIIKERKKAIFLTEIGPDVFTTLSNLIAPRKPKEISLDDIEKCLEKHYNPKPLEITESFHFGTRNQKPGESVNDFIVALKKLSIHCNYGGFLDRALRDRFVCGLNSVKIQNKLLNSADLTFDRACQIAKTMEMAERNTQELHTSTGELTEKGTVNKITTTNENIKEQSVSPKNEYSCYRCGGKHHSNNCKFRNAKCFKCSKIGHIASVCKNNESRANLSKTQGNVHNVCDEGREENDELGLFSVENVMSNNRSKYKVEMSLNGCMCEMEVDTAADRSIMSKSTYTQNFSKIPLLPSSARLRTYTGETLSVCGEMLCDVVYKGQEYSLPILVANYESKPTLLGPVFGNLCRSKSA